MPLGLLEFSSLRTDELMVEKRHQRRRIMHEPTLTIVSERLIFRLHLFASS